MKSATASALLGALLAATAEAVPTVDELYPYKGPDVPIGDWVNPTVNGNGKGFPRLVEAPAVKPASKNPTNNVNVISLSYVPAGMNIHFQTPFGIGASPSVRYGSSPSDLSKTATGQTKSYDRTPPCSEIAAVTQCSQFFHDVTLHNLKPATKYYYQIPAGNGTTESDVLSFTTARAAGDDTEFSVIMLNDMGYTNAQGTFKYINKAVDDGAVFLSHGGDISYADDWYSGILPCEDSWPVCYNGTSTELPGTGPIPKDYDTPLPAGEIANQGGPRGGDMSVLYESNWDLWQQWVNTITTRVPYMVLPGNHEASCAEFDGPGNILSAYLDSDIANGTVPKSKLNYYSCPPSQRNFTAYQNRFHMAGEESGGVGNFWYSWEYGLAHFVSIDTETDFPSSPEFPFARDLKGNETHPLQNQTFVTDSGPFGAVNGNFSDNEAYEQYQWLAKDLASVDRCKTPWVIVMSHRPMYSSQVSSYQKAVRNAFEALMIKNGVDAYISGHIHWYERMLPMGRNGTIDKASFIDNNTYMANPGVSITHLVNGAAGNIESHSTLGKSPLLNITAFLDQTNFGFGTVTIHNSSALSWQFIHGEDGDVGDHLTLLKKQQPSCSAGPSGSSTAVVSTTVASTAPTDTASSSGSGVGVTTTTEVVTAYTTYCPGNTAITIGSKTYTVTEATTLTITDCPCTITKTIPQETAAPTSIVTVPGNPGESVTAPEGAPGATGGATTAVIASPTGGFSNSSGSTGAVSPAPTGGATGGVTPPPVSGGSSLAVSGLLGVAFFLALAL